MSEYHDRGIIKWAPFEAVADSNELLEKLIYNLEKSKKAILSEDELDELNRNLEKAIETQKEVIIKYFKDGYLLDTFGSIKSVDQISKTINLKTGESVKIDDIVDIKIGG